MNCTDNYIAILLIFHILCILIAQTVLSSDDKILNVSSQTFCLKKNLKLANLPKTKENHKIVLHIFLSSQNTKILF